MEEYKPYNPKEVESEIYRFWEEKSLFIAPSLPKRKVFSMVMPPPNITGALHLGHALDLTLSDVIVRFNHLINKDVLWLPGIDQAGIATQNVIEKELAKKGMSRETLGREKFIDEVWMWKKNYGGRIVEQIKLLGLATDWSRLRFTKDELYERAVKVAFMHYYNKGLIYKGKRIINYCPRCETAISDIEVDYIEEQSELYYIKYPLENSSDFIVVATTRPETMLGDTAVAVNPVDARYVHLIGKIAILPIVERKIPIIADESVDPAFGTGAVKVTPAHDPTDFEIGKRHGLAEISILDKGKTLNENALKFKGLTMKQARKEIIEELKRENLLDHVEPYVHSVGTCERCSSKVEPIISDQWFLKTKELSEEAVKRVEAGEVKFKPERWKKIFIDWMENIQDWCISRQIWWGIQIPVWYCSCGEILVSVDAPKMCSKCGNNNFTQDTDVLDTWFGSALWPFASMGWPDDTLELKYYYPTSLLITGFDIIFFWVARMIFSGIEFTGSVPFKEVLLHGLIRDKYGKKMSKSLNNVIYPEELITNYGADALRFSLIISSSFGGQDINFDVQKVISSRNFINKVWNAGRFVLNALRTSTINLEEECDLSIWDKWIVHKLSKTIQKVKEGIENYKINESCLAIYNFFWDDFCDWYIEESKINLNLHVLKDVFETSLILLHPFMPFVTEKLWQMLNSNDESILKSSFPQELKDDGIDEVSLKEVELLKEIIKAIRNLKNEFNMLFTKETGIFFTASDEKTRKIIEKNIEMILKLAKIEDFVYREELPTNSITSHVEGLNIYLPIQNISNVKKEIELKLKKLGKLEAELGRLKERLNNADFRANAPKEVISETEEKIFNIENERDQLKNRLEQLSKIT